MNASAGTHVDVLLLHVPRMRRRFNQIMVMPSGLFSLADCLDRAGLRVRILHLGLELQANPAFSLPDYLRRHQVKLLAVSLHWFYQTWDVIHTINQVKRELPELPVVVGGYTASCFYRDLALRGSVDFVIRGDGELPLLRLCEQLWGTEPPRLEQVPNLVWKGDGGRVHQTPLSFESTPAFMVELSHARLDLLERSGEYFSDRVLYKDFDERIEANRGDFFSNAYFYTPGRGCGFDCLFCGGSRSAQHRLFGRSGAFFFDDDKIIRDLEELHRQGIRTLRVSFDPERDRATWLRLFERIRVQGLSFTLVFDCWTLPDGAFARAVKATFLPDSLLVISPDSGSEEVRRRNKSCFYTNGQLLDSLGLLAAHEIRRHVFFGVGLPFETAADLAQTRSMALQAAATGAHVSVLPLDRDPCSLVQVPFDAHPDSVPGTGLRQYFEVSRSDAPAFPLDNGLLSMDEIERFIAQTIAALNSAGPAAP